MLCIASRERMADKAVAAQEKQLKAATKALAGVFKAWNAALKSKDVQQMAAVSQVLHDDDYLRFGGGIDTLMKVASGKDAPSRLLALRMLVDVLAAPDEEPCAEAWRSPHPKYVRRCIAAAQAGIALGHAVSEPQLHCSHACAAAAICCPL